MKLILSVLAVLSLLLTACPEDIIDYSGTWSGTATYTSGPCGTSTSPLVLTIVHVDNNLSGTLVLDDVTYQFAGTIDSEVFDLFGSEVGDNAWQSVEIDGVFNSDSAANGSFVHHWDGDCLGVFTVSHQ